MAGPLEGLRVLELATGIAGPYGGRLLAMLGASVVKLEPEGGDPVRRQPVDGRPLAGPSPLHLHLNAGKRLLSREAVELGEQLAWADVVVDGSVRNQLEGTPLDPERLQRDPAAPLLVTTSAWGFEAEDAGRMTDELLVQAAAGVMSATGDPDGPPLRFPGFQTQYFSGAYVAAGALAGLRKPGCRHVDVPWIHAIASGVEASWSRNLHTNFRERPAGPHQLDVFPSGALPCADGFVVPGTIRPTDWLAQCEVYGRPELASDERFRSRRRRRANREELWSTLRPWYAARTRQQIFDAALEAGWALGMVLQGTDVAADPHLAARGFLGDPELSGSGGARAPVRPWLAPGLPVTPLAEIGDGAASAASSERLEAGARRPLDRVRVLEVTQAWAGPFVGRLLGALGADVVKVEGAVRPDGWRVPARFGDLAPDLGRDPDELSVEISPNWNSLNRNKRHCVIDLTKDEGRGVFLDLVRVADVVVANMTARVLPKLRLAYADLAFVNDRIILIHMPALGASGPFRDAAGYGSVVEGMGGFGGLFGAPDEGARISQTYYPDPVAGLHASVAALSMLERRDRTGQGGEVDLSHQETLWLQLGEAIVAAGEGGCVERVGNRVPGTATSGVFPTQDGRFVAVASAEPCDELVRDSERHSCAELLEALRERGAPATEVLHFAEARDSDAMAPAIERVRHAVTRERPYLRVPLRLDGAPVETRLPAPTFDRHTREVLADWLGYGAARIDALAERGAVGGTPDPEALRAFYRMRSRR